MTPSPRIMPFTEHGFLVRFDSSHDVSHTGLHAGLLAQQLLETPFWLDVTPSIDSLAARYDPARIAHDDAFAIFKNMMSKPVSDHLPTPSSVLEIPVLYGGDDGPDLEALCEASGLSEKAVIDAHTQNAVRVISMGFAPGFAYLGPVAEQLIISRRKSPRTKVPAGSVGIADQFTGIYSMVSPGGWQIIGRTPVALIDIQESPSFLLQPNVEVHFRAIDVQEFNKILQEQR